MIIRTGPKEGIWVDNDDFSPDTATWVILLLVLAGIGAAVYHYFF